MCQVERYRIRRKGRQVRSQSWKKKRTAKKNKKKQISMGVRERGWWGRRKQGHRGVREVELFGEESKGKGEAGGHSGSESAVIALTLSWLEVCLSQSQWWILRPRPLRGNKVTAHRGFFVYDHLEKKHGEKTSLAQRESGRAGFMVTQGNC